MEAQQETQEFTQGVTDLLAPFPGEGKDFTPDVPQENKDWGDWHKGPQEAEVPLDFGNIRNPKGFAEWKAETQKLRDEAQERLNARQQELAPKQEEPKQEEPATEAKPAEPEPAQQEAKPVETQQDTADTQFSPILDKDMEAVIAAGDKDKITTALKERETQWRKNVDALKPALTAYKQVAEPLLNYGRQVGKNGEEFSAFLQNSAYFDASLTDQRLTNEQKLEKIIDLVKLYGIDFNDYYTANPPYLMDENKQPLDPRDKLVYEAHQREQAAQRQVEAIRREQQVASQQQATAQSQSYAQMRNADGSLRYPHYAQLEPMVLAYGNAMVSQARQAGKADPTFDDVYNAAAWADPTIRQQMIAQQQPSIAQKKAEQAKIAAKGVAGNGPASSAPLTMTGMRPRDFFRQIAREKGLI